MDIEVALRPNSSATHADVRESVITLVRATNPLSNGADVSLESDEALAAHAQHVRVFINEGTEEPLQQQQQQQHAHVHVHVHHLFDEEPTDQDVGEAGEEAVAFQMWTLPALEFDGLWESLVFDEDDVQPR